MSDKMNYKNILLAALGTTPQIITESLYYLMVAQKIPIHEIHLITTTTGKKKAEGHLYQNGEGPFYQFCKEYGFSSTEITIKYHLIENQKGEPLPDIRTPEENQAAADYFLRVVRELTSRAETRMFATIAGGRKTMSAYLYFTMQLLGRKQDTLYHVLVHPESIESNPAFFYPRKDREIMEFQDKNKKPFSVPVKEIRIDMAEIPFVRMRRILKEGLIDSIDRFSELIALTQEEIDRAQFEPEVEINLSAKSLIVKNLQNTYQIRLRPVQMCLYYYLARHGSLLNSKAGNPEAVKKMLQLYQKEYAIAGVNKKSFEYERLMEMRSKINSTIRKAIPSPLLQEFLFIHSDEKYGGATFSLKLSPSKIRITNSDFPDPS